MYVDKCCTGSKASVLYLLIFIFTANAKTRNKSRLYLISLYLPYKCIKNFRRRTNFSSCNCPLPNIVSYTLYIWQSFPFLISALDLLHGEFFNKNFQKWLFCGVLSRPFRSGFELFRRDHRIFMHQLPQLTSSTLPHSSSLKSLFHESPEGIEKNQIHDLW